jgi:hypothetical protein
VKYAHLRLPSFAPTLVVLSTLAVAGCSSDKHALLAPSDALITMTPAAPLVTVNGNVDVTIQAAKSDGSSVADGTEIFLSASRGQFSTPKVRIQSGKATARYQASADPGLVELIAQSDTASGQYVLPTASGNIARITLTASQGAVPYGGGEVVLKATVFDEGNQRVVGAPVIFQSSTGSFTPFAPVITNDNGEAIARLSTTDPATTRARVHTSESVSINISVENPLSLKVVANPSPSTVGQPVKVTVTPSDSKRVGEVILIYGDGQVQPLGQGAGVRSTSYTYSTVGGFNLTAVFKSTVGTEVRETIRHNVAGIAPNPPPGNNPGSGGGGVVEQPGLPFSVGAVEWLHADVSGWRVSSQITDITITSDEICIYHTKSGRWPSYTQDGVVAEGNPWVLANVGGKWYASTYEYLKVGQTCKHIERRGEWGIGAHTKREPLESWVPRKGELVGFMVSTPARDSTRTSNERSNIVMVRWPY